MAKKKLSKIIQSVLGGRLADIEDSIASGESIDATDVDRRTALMHAVIDGNLEAVQLLLSRGAATDIQDRHGYTALHFAAQNNHLGIARALLEGGASVDLRDEYGNTPLFRAVFASTGEGDLIRLLLSHGANRDLKNTSDVSPVDLARTIGNYDVAQFFND
jgi:ankyrin repeat protein